MQQALGEFDVKLPNQPPAEGTEAAQLGRRAILKEFRGDLQGSSLGEMLAAGSTVPGSAGYVAMERVEGSLAGRSGSFVLMHFGVMDRGQSSLTIRVVPDSGTDGLAGLIGTMNIDIRDGHHFYRLDYELPPA
ncbi:DUF3224 domain-containing protein [Albitalea terrae]|uniref:DUF3224 domain-containing protein n=2 Tax=Piscinibacter terrae TaxID=2496871 RepID=A0A3N7HIW1_9BURK|nr:DUF3224 domain-containing protein [Albitalea terrae]